MAGSSSIPPRPPSNAAPLNVSTPPVTTSAASATSSSGTQSTGAQRPQILPDINSLNLNGREGSKSGLKAFEPDAVLARPRSPAERARAQSVASVAQAANARLASRTMFPPIAQRNLLADEPYLGPATAEELDPPNAHFSGPGMRDIDDDGVNETKNEGRPTAYETKHGSEPSEPASGKSSAAQIWQAKHGSRAGQRALKARIPEQGMSDTQSLSSQGSQGKDKGGASSSQPSKADMAYTNIEENKRKYSVLSNPSSVASGSTSSGVEALRVPQQPMLRSASGSQLPDFRTRPAQTSKRIAAPLPEDPTQLRWSLPLKTDAYGGATYGEIVPIFDKWMSIQEAREQVMDVLRRGYLDSETAFLARCEDFKNAPRDQRYAVLADIIEKHLTVGADMQVTVQGHELVPLLAEFERAIPGSNLRFDGDLAKAFRGVRNNAVGLLHSLVSRDPGGAYPKILRIVEQHDTDKATAARRAMLAQFQAKQAQPPKEKDPT